MILPTADSRSVTPGIKLAGGKMQIFVINLPRATERRMFQEGQFKRLSLKFHLLEATCVNKISDETYQKHYRDWQRPLRKTEVACYYSHRFAWEKVIETGKPALILEDDALLSKRTPEVLKILDEINDADIIQLEVRGRKKLISRNGINITPNHQLLRLYLDRTGAAGYALWPSGARKLLEHEKKTGIGLADAHITSCYNLVGFQLEPALIIQLDQCAYYKITSPFATHSQILDQPKPSHRNWLFFKFKRMAAQLGMATRQIRFFCQANRREVLLIPGDFVE